MLCDAPGERQTAPRDELRMRLRDAWPRCPGHGCRAAVRGHGSTPRCGPRRAG